MPSSSLSLLQITFWLLMISPFAFSRIFPMNQTLIILPLTTQNLHNFSLPTSFQRRRFSSYPPIKTPITYDDVILTIHLTAGSPPQSISMLLDTGSELSWLHCKQSSTLTSIFDHAKSSSYTPLPCSSPICTTQNQDLNLPATLCDSKAGDICYAAVSYNDGSSFEGNLAQETFGIGSSTIPQTSFGCMDVSSSTSPDDTATGLMGMNQGRLSFVNQMGLSKFSYCISSSDSTGVLVFGDASVPSLPSLQYTPMVTKMGPLPYWDRFAYTVQLEGIQVGSKVLPIPSSEFVPNSHGAGQTVFDSGTTFTFMRDSVYNVLKTEFTEQTKSILTIDPNPVYAALDLCFRVGSTQLDYSKLPTVTLMFTGAELTVSGQQLLFLVPISGVGPNLKYCFTFGNSKLAGIKTVIIGNHHQQNVRMEYDLAQKKVGFANNVKCNQVGHLLGSQL